MNLIILCLRLKISQLNTFISELYNKIICELPPLISLHSIATNEINVNLNFVLFSTNRK